MSTFLYGAHIQANGIRQHYLRYGGKGETIIIIPGITSPAITWGFVAERLGQNFDIYILDVRGRGLSSTGEELSYSTETCAKDVSAFAMALELNGYYIIGHSMGARFAVVSAALFSENLKGLVLVDPPVSGPERRVYPSQLAWYVDSINESLEGIDLERMRHYCPTWTEEQLCLRAEWLPTCYLPAIIQAFNDFHDVDIHQYLPKLSIPTLLIIAGRGNVILAEDEIEILGLQPKIQITRVENAGHMIPWDDLEGFFNALGNF